MARNSLSSWLGTAAPASGRDRMLAPDTAGLLDVMRRGSPGQWSQRVWELAKHFTGSTFLAVNTLATQASGSEFEIYERTEDESVPRGKKKLPYHDPIHQLYENPNNQDSWEDHIYQQVQQICLTGIALEWNVPNERGDEPQELYSIPSATAWPMPPSYDYPHGAYRVLPYPYGLMGAPVGQIAAGAVIPAEQIVVVKNHHPILRYDGYAVLTACSQQTDTLEAIDKSRLSEMLNGCQQSMVLELPAESNPNGPDISRYRAQIEAHYRGPMNAGKLFLAYGGAKVRNLNVQPSEMGWETGFNQLLDFNLACFGVPKAVAGIQDSLSYATLYASLRAFTLLSLQPLLKRFAVSKTKQTIRPHYGNQFGMLIHAPEFRDESLIEQQIANDMKGGIRTNEELRDLRGLDKIKESWIKERCTANYQPQGAVPGSPRPPGGSVAGPPRMGAETDQDVDNARPKSPGKSLNGHRRETLLAALEHGKTRGAIKSIRE